MKDLILAKDHLLEHQLNFVLVRDNQVLKTSKDRGIRPILNAYRDNSLNFKDSCLADRVIGKAAAMFLISGGIKSLYTDLISDVAYELLRARGIQVEYGEKVPNILNQEGNDLCPMEKLSSDARDLEDLIEKIEIFLGINTRKECIS
ncbi:MAG: DUF1893 domain-containing protein [Tissierellaceae bacterium]|jgi:hypothetical protein|nr:DUF1893 domain-containing protein [Tissierellia bacterium]